MRNIHVIINQQSGTAKNTDLPNFKTQIEEILNSYRITPTIHFKDGKDINQTLKDAITQNPESIIVGGGDGTINAAADLLENTGIPLGILPMGTFNLAARDHDIPLDLETALHTLATATPQNTPLLRISGIPCLCVTIIGFYPRMNRIMEDYHGTQWWKKTWNIFRISILRFSKAPIYEIEIEREKSTIPHRVRMLTIVPGAYKDTLGIMPERTSTTPLAATIYLFKHLTRLQMLRGIFSFLTGRLSKDEDMQTLSINNAKIHFDTQKQIKLLIDGENHQLNTPIQATLTQNTLKILHPTT